MKSEQETLEQLKLVLNIHMDSDKQRALWQNIECEVSNSKHAHLRHRRSNWLATGGAAFAAVAVTVVSVAALSNHPKHQTRTLANNQSNNFGAVASSIDAIQPDQIKNLSIDGWGPGATGNSIRPVPNPLGQNGARAVLSALQHGKIVQNKNFVKESAISQGGASWLVIELNNGKFVYVEYADIIFPMSIIPAKNTYFVSLDQKIGVFIEDPTGTIENTFRAAHESTVMHGTNGRHQ